MVVPEYFLKGDSNQQPSWFTAFCIQLEALEVHTFSSMTISQHSVAI